MAEAVGPSMEATEEAEEAEERAAEAREALLAEEEEGMAEGSGQKGHLLTDKVQTGVHM